VSDYEAAYRDVRLRVTDLLREQENSELEQVLADWADHAGTVEPMLNDIGQPMGQLVFDVWTHEQDIRGALGEPGGRDSAATEVAFGWWVEAARSQPVDDGAPGAIRLVTEHGAVELGPGEPAFENAFFSPAARDIVE
jgi:hypothetical protein